MCQKETVLTYISVPATVMPCDSCSSMGILIAETIMVMDIACKLKNNVLGHCQYFMKVRMASKIRRNHQKSECLGIDMLWTSQTVANENLKI